jgi:hypothetical protein
MDPALAVAPQELLIAAAHLSFAVQCFRSMRGAPKRVQRAWAAILIVSGLCAANGYAAPALCALLDLDPRDPWLSALRYWGHWLLAIAAWTVALSSAPHIISQPLGSDRRRS